MPSLLVVVAVAAVEQVMRVVAPVAVAPVVK
jgi:hypothetical protein